MTDSEHLLKNHNILSQVHQLIKQNKKVSAIKLVKDTIGLELKECKEIVDTISSLPVSNGFFFDSESKISVDEIFTTHKIEEQLTALLQQNSKLEAIKLVVDHTGMSLLDAKNFVESIQNKETTFTLGNIDRFSNINVKMTNINGKITVKIKEGKNPERVIYPNDPNWEKAMKMLGNKPELIVYETEFLNGKHAIPQKKSNLFVETNSYGKWILFFVLFCLIMLFIYFYGS